MNPVIQYIKENSFGYNNPVSSSQIEAAFEIKGIEIRKKINEARCAGEPICSCSKGYYYSENKEDIIKTIDSMRGRIRKQENAISGLQTLCT